MPGGLPIPDSGPKHGYPPTDSHPPTHSYYPAHDYPPIHPRTFHLPPIPGCPLHYSHPYIEPDYHLLPKRPVRPGHVSSCRVKASVPWERLPSKRVTAGTYSPHPSSAVLARLLQSSRITCRARPLPAALTCHLQPSLVLCGPRQLPAGPGRHPELPGKLRHLRHLQGPPVRPGSSSGRTPRYPPRP